MTETVESTLQERVSGTPATKPPWSPRAIGWIAFFFSFLPAGLMSAYNFERLGQPEKKRNRIIITVVGFAIFMTLAFVSPEHSILDRLFGIANTIVAAMLYAEQKKLQTAYAKNDGPTASVWPVVGMSIGGIILIFVAVFGYFIALDFYAEAEYERGFAAHNAGNFAEAHEAYDFACGIDYLQPCIPKPIPGFDDSGDACVSDYPNACYNLGALHVAGLGVEADPTRAAGYYNVACEGGIVGACADLGRALRDGEGVLANPRRSAELFQLACGADDAGACVSLGVAYLNGHGVAADPAAANRYWKSGCELGHSQGCFNLAVSFDTGKGVEADPTKALEMYRRACNGKIAVACHNVGIMANRGEGMPRDTELAEAAFAKACELGNESSCGTLPPVKGASK